MEKPFAVFKYAPYYPVGGWKDCIGVFATQGEALMAAHAPHPKYGERDCDAHIVDLRVGDVLEISLNGPDDDE